MATEIERKFLLRNDSWRDGADAGTRFRQGYLIGSERASVRVRIEGARANLNIKSATLGIRRQEYEYPIPLADAEALLDTLCEQPQIEKTRYHVPFGNHLWEVDVFAGANAGLVVAEVELTDEEEAFALPPWAGEEVSHDTRYYNVCLVKHPYSEWRYE
ncbi:MAG: CYTH domain-containing protein [Gammaproteobacteria bacterium]|nr:CYTH domain-containing protein [Gammaproteobacteria bacterium]